ncbi:MAG: T9SS type A sorting domain-containing protein [Bacteroidetes bacterium]|nr:T9SS type A sorting domain-containing protein [Bacteroidota bacterium]MBL6944513.1 T9SS type A sorting domain-containing protein [Bacteroidales bacterium]
MKKLFIITLIIIGIFSFSNAQNTILEARGMPVGTVVTVSGIATNGSELGIIRYMQDATAGIAAYGSAVGVVNRGDSITVTGTLKIYNQLLELDPIASVVVNSSGNTVPNPILLTPIQLSESYESQLVKINDVIFNDGGQTFTGNKKYTFTANGETGYVYIKNGQDFVGTIIPSAPVEMTAICSQFDYSNPNAGYQVLPRDLNDIFIPGSIYFVGALSNTNFTHTTLDFSWNTNIAGTTEMFYGTTAETVTSNITSSTGGTANHNIDLSGLNAGEITWVQAFSVSGSDTAKSAIVPFATISNSSGDMKAYFNSAIDVSYSNGVDAIYLPQTFDDTLISYIDRAKYTIDFTIYNFNNDGISNISDALKDAANRGVRVRVIGCGTTANLGIDELAGSAVHVLIGPSSSQRTGIMHNKFIVFDAQSNDPNDPLVWTGSTNFTDGQINLDANNVIIVQDQSLARAYQIEFEEMWGSYGNEPNAANARFGSEKMNNTPHEFMIAGKRVECYFSPSDGVNGKIVEVINTSDNDLSVATMLITRIEMAEAIVGRKSAGVAVNVITNAEGNNNATVNSMLAASLTTHVTFDNVSSGMLHHKYMIVDQCAPASDPMLFTGSHNWSAAADNDNDENTLIIHDATMANIYYQQFVKRFVDNQGVLFELTEPPTAVNDNVETTIEQLITVMVLDNDMLLAPISLSIETQATQGNSYIPFANPNVISYLPNAGFHGTDSLVYKIAYQAEPTLFATAKVYITVIDNSGIEELFVNGKVDIYPNPADDQLKIEFIANHNTNLEIGILDISGRVIMQHDYSASQGANKINLNLNSISHGVYLLSIGDNYSSLRYKVVVK